MHKLIFILCCVLALAVRILLPHSQLYLGSTIVYNTVDAYYQMRIVDDIIANYPHIPATDPYFLYPGTTGITTVWPFLIATVAWLIGLGHPSKELVDLTGAYLPALMGMLVLIPTYILARATFNRHIALVAVAILAILPGEWLARSVVGATDYHVLEVLLLTSIVMFAVLYVKYRKWPYAALGIALFGLYLATWEGAPLFLFVLTVAVAVWLAVNNRFRKLITIGFAVFLVGMFIYGIFQKQLAFILPDAIYWPLARFIDIFIWHTAESTAEQASVLFTAGRFTLEIAWNYFLITFFLSFLGIGMVVRQAIKNKSFGMVLVMVWTVVLLLMTLSMRRFAYYYAVNAALMSAVLIHGLYSVVWYQLKHLKSTVKLDVNVENIVLVTLAVICVVLVPTAQMTYNVATSRNDSIITPDWMESMQWLRANTPNPFTMSKTVPDYTVLSWWDYGYWITREAQRVPICNPGGGARQSAAWFFVAQSEADAHNGYGYRDIQTTDYARSRYIVIDNAMISGKFYAMPQHAYKNKDLFITGRQMAYKDSEPVMLFYPDYYRSMAVRLFNFGALAYKTGSVTAIKLSEGSIAESKQFDSEQKARQAIGTDWQIVGTDPFVSCVDLEPLLHYRMIHVSPERTVRIFEWDGVN